MLTKRENFLETIRGGNPDRLVNGFEAFASWPHPIMKIEHEGAVPPTRRGDAYQDRWGTTYVFPEGEPGPMPIVTAENKVVKDITKWREQLVVPDYSKFDLDWGEIRDFYGRVDKTELLTATTMNVGLFERTHNLLGFEDALVNLLLCPDEMHALLDTLLDARIAMAELIMDNCAPEVIIHHDDWGSKHALFMSPGTWREFFKERYRKLYRHMTERGVIAIHHGDSFQQPIAGDMAEIGVVVWQGAIPANDIPQIIRALREARTPMTLMGGIACDEIDVENWSEDAVRRETRRACETYGANGCFIPSITYGGPRSIYPGVNETIMDEVSRYNAAASGL